LTISFADCDAITAGVLGVVEGLIGTLDEMPRVVS
jgi:hypothetical protein